MDSHSSLMLKVSRLLPSSFTSCSHFRALPDVAETSITSNKIPHENDLSNPKKPLPASVPKRSRLMSQGRKCPPKMDKFEKQNPLLSVTHSSSSWFTSGDDLETDTFFSISSNSGDSFRGRMSGRKCQEMKSIDERSHYDTVLVNQKTTGSRPEVELGSDHISTQMYYGSEEGLRRRRKRRKPKKTKTVDYRSMIGESHAVEKSSRDPGGDFRASMVEMILEKQIFAAPDLERLLLCFLSLNAVSYHGVIFDVFSEICDTLFSN